MEPITLAAIAAGAYFLLRKKKKTATGNLNYPRIIVAADCSKWDIPDPWYDRYAAPSYVSLLSAYPDSLPLDTRVSRITESILLGQTGACAAKDVPNLPGTMRGLFDHVAEYVRDGLQNGGNPFLPGLARYVVASETMTETPSPTAILVVRRYELGGGQTPYGWAVGKYGVTLSQIMSKLATLDAETDDEIEELLVHFGGSPSIEAALAKARQTALLGPSDSTSGGEHLFG